MSPRNQCDPVEGMRDACAAIAARLADAVSRSADRLSDYDRGELAAARHIEREIRALRVATEAPRSDVSGPTSDVPDRGPRTSDGRP